MLVLVIHLFLFAGQMEVAYVIPVLFLSNSLGTPLLPKTIENQDFEMALSNADNKELLQKWYQLDGHAQPPCYRLQPIASHIPGFKVWANKFSAEIEIVKNVNVISCQFSKFLTAISQNKLSYIKTYIRLM
jgi:hypothetical protein